MKAKSAIGSWWPRARCTGRFETARSCKLEQTAAARTWCDGPTVATSLFSLAGRMWSMSSGRMAVPAVSRVQRHHPARRPRWQVDIYLYEDQVQRLQAPCTVMCRRRSTYVVRLAAVRPIRICPVGDEVAAARALEALADRLLEMASSDLSDAEGHRVAEQLSHRTSAEDPRSTRW